MKYIFTEYKILIALINSFGAYFQNKDLSAPFWAHDTLISFQLHDKLDNHELYPKV